MSKNSLASLAVAGRSYDVRVTPNARIPQVMLEGEKIKISVSQPASDGQANVAVTKVLAKALGVAKSRLTLVRGHKSRDKTFRLD